MSSGFSNYAFFAGDEVVAFERSAIAPNFSLIADDLRKTRLASPR
jgi:hypothetical protein